MSEWKLWYRNPATTWDEVLPFGNGFLGGMVWGDATRERIGLNECTLWSGYPRDKNNPRALAALDRVRALVSAGDYKQAQALLEKDMLGEFTESYMPLGDLLLENADESPIVDYNRELDLTDACVRVRYTQQGIEHSRTYFASNPHRVMILRLQANDKEIDTIVRFDSQLRYRTEARDGALWVMGQCPDHVDPDYTGIPDPIVWGEQGIRFEAVLRVLDTDGEVIAKDCSLHIQHASYAVLSWTAVHNPDLAMEYKALGYEGLYTAHCVDYRLLYDRVELDLGTQLSLPTDERLQRLKTGEDDPGLYALYFQFGRYLMISASRPGGLPMNLQGLWNWLIQPPWSSNYTTNINAQMNYWPALACGLAECMEPYNRFVEMLCANGQKTASIHYGCRGFTLGHNTDRWASTNPVGVVHGQTHGMEDSGRYAYFPLGGVWMAQLLWRYYEYTGDQDFLEHTAYPILRQGSLFCVDYLVEKDGFMVVCPSTSPENAFYTTSGEVVSVAYAGTMEMTLVRESFDLFAKACTALGKQDELLAEIDKAKAKLYPYKIGRYGQLQEWFDDFEEPEPGHRHVSHTYGLYPSELFYGDESLTQGCKVTLERRLANGGGHTGWSCAWLINLFAVLHDGEKAFEQLHTLLTRSTYPNLWDGHPPFQIDGNFGGIAGIANMLVQDRGGEVVFLPALPKAFANGSVKGLRIKGCKALDMRWQDGVLVEKREYPCSDA